MASFKFNSAPFTVDSENVTYTDDEILAKYTYETVLIQGSKVSLMMTMMIMSRRRRMIAARHAIYRETEGNVWMGGIIHHHGIFDGMGLVGISSSSSSLSSLALYLSSPHTGCA